MTMPALRSAALCAILAAATVSAQPPATPPAFRFERPIVTDGSGPRRLPIDVPLLVGGAPFWGSRVRRSRWRDRRGRRRPADLRLYDANGAEVGYLIVRNSPAAPTYRLAAILPVATVDTDSLKASGFEADLGELMPIDRFRIDGLKPPFLKRVRLEASGDRGHWTTLVSEGTLFDLPEENLRQIELRFDRGSYRYLRVTWDDTNSARLARPSGAAAGHAAGAVPSAPPLTTPVTFERRPSEPGRSRFRIHLPGGHLPVAMLHLDVGGGHILRVARAFEPRLSGARLTPVMLGQATLARVVRGSLTAADLRIGLQPPTGAQLDLEVDDGDNPALDLRGVTVEFAALPWIFLEAPGGALTARYGNSTMSAPSYDLEAARDEIRIESVTEAKWGEPRARNAEENAASASPPVPTIGAALDTALFKFVRVVPAGRAGLLAVGLDANVLAHSAGPRRGFGDLRVVDAADRQIPYLVEQTVEPLSLDVAVDKIAAPAALPAARAGRSVYRVTYPVEGLPSARLVLSTPARVFERRVMAVEERDADPVRRDRWIETIDTASWVHADSDRPAMPLTLSLRPPHAASLLVIVEEGDNAPLPIERAQLLLPAYRLRLYRADNARLRASTAARICPAPQHAIWPSLRRRCRRAGG
jgi:hypothetical protein